MSVTRSRHIPASAALVAALALPASADVTAQEVWENWQQSLALGGPDLDVSFDEVIETPGRLSVPNLRLSIESNETDLEVLLANVTFRERGDGRVSVELPEIVPVALVVEDPLRSTITLTARISFDDARLIASGAPDALSQSLTATAMKVALDGVTGLATGSGIDGTVTLRNLSSTSLVTRLASGAREAVATLNARALTYSILSRDPFSGTTSIDYTNSGLRIESETRSPANALTMDPAALLRSDAYSVDVTLTTEGGVTNVEVTDRDSTGRLNTQIAAASLGMSLEDGALSYEIEVEDMDLSAAIDTVPLPVSATLGSLGLRLASPLIASEEDGDFVLDFALSDLAIDDALWDLFDPQATFPRAPFSLEADIAGTGRWLIDLFDPKLGEDGGLENFPAVLSEVTISSILLSGAGAKIAARGDFTFDESNLAAFNGFPAPDGSVDVTMEGINGLFEGLVAMGLIEASQALGVRFVLGLYATPAPDGSDAFTSQIVVDPSGEVTANGQRIR